MNSTRFLATSFIFALAMVLNFEAKTAGSEISIWPIIQRGVVTTIDEAHVEARRTTQVRSLLADGTMVKRGDPLCTLVMADREDELKKRLSDLDSARVNYRKTNEGQVFEQALVSMKLELARLEMNRAREEFEKETRKRDWLKILEESEASKVRQREITLLKGKLLARLNLEKKGFGVPLDRLTYEDELGKLELERAHSNRLLPWIKSKPVEKDVLEARMSLDAASAGLELAELEEASQRAIQKVWLTEARQNLDEAASFVSRIHQEIASGTLVASVSGMVVRGVTWSGAGWEKVSEGDRVYPGRSFMSILNLDTLGLEVPLEQRFAGIIRPGCVLRFRPDAFPEKVFTAVATEVPSVVIETQFRDPEGERALTFKARFRESAPRLRVGYSGTVEIFPPGSDSSPITSKPKSSGRSFQLTRSNFPFHRELTVPGEVKARQRGLVAPAFSARLAFLLEDGISVKKDDVVAKLDTAELEKGLGDLKIQLQNKIQRLELQRQKNRVESNRWARSVQIKESAMRVAAIDQQTLISRRNETEIINLGKNRDLLTARIALARETASHTEVLNQRGMASKIDVADREIEGIRLEKERAVNAYKLDLETDGPSGRQIRLSILALRKAVLEHQQTIIEAGQAGFIARMDEESAEAEINKIKIDVEEKEDRLRKAALKAPQDGVVILPEVWKEEGLSKMRLGDQANRQIPFMHIANMNSLEIALDVPETDVSFITTGQEVKVTVKSAPGRFFKGWISSVGAVADTDLLERQEARVEVFVALANPAAGVKTVDEAFRPGASCEVTMTLYNRDGAVIAPFDAVIPTASGPALMEEGGNLIPFPIAFSDGLAGFVASDSSLEGRSFVIPVAGP